MSLCNGGSLPDECKHIYKVCGETENLGFLILRDAPVVKTYCLNFSKRQSILSRLRDYARMRILLFNAAVTRWRAASVSRWNLSRASSCLVAAFDWERRHRFFIWSQSWSGCSVNSSESIDLSKFFLCVANEVAHVEWSACRDGAEGF